MQWTTDRVLRSLDPDPGDPVWTAPTAGVVLLERPVPRQIAGQPLTDLEAGGLGRIAAVGTGRPVDVARAHHGRPGGRRRLGGRAGRIRSRTTTEPSALEPGGSLMRVLIVGGGKVGTFIASELAPAGHEVVIMEQSQARHAEIAVTGADRRRRMAPRRRL